MIIKDNQSLKYMISNKRYILVHTQDLTDCCQSCQEIDIEYVDEEINFKVKIGISTLDSFNYYIESYHNLKPINRKEIDPGLLENYRIQMPHPPKYTGLNIWTDTITSIPDKHMFSYMYKDMSGDIFLEIIPVYPDHDENAPAFDEWIKDYKPIAIVPLTKETLASWDEYVKQYFKDRGF